MHNRSFKFLLLFALTACQTGYYERPEDKEKPGRFYFHSASVGFVGDIKIKVDDKEFDEFKKISKYGLDQESGDHKLQFFNLPMDSGLKELAYKIESGKELHLYYCQGDGTFTWTTNKVGKKPLKPKSCRGFVF